MEGKFKSMIGSTVIYEVQIPACVKTYILDESSISTWLLHRNPGKIPKEIKKIGKFKSPRKLYAQRKFGRKTSPLSPRTIKLALQTPLSTVLTAHHIVKQSKEIPKKPSRAKIIFWDTYKGDSDEDNHSTNSSSFKSFSIAFSNNKDVPIKGEKVDSVIKKKNKKLKRKAKNLKKYIKKLQKQVIFKHKMRLIKEWIKNVPSLQISLTITMIPRFQRAPMYPQMKNR